ncbi:MAG: hypothetical protein GJ680_07830 [Alteromonadaceae bacterium]|nr:hypothetical protein [Alteromonadaceae bacterium]
MKNPLPVRKTLAVKGVIIIRFGRLSALLRDDSEAYWIIAVALKHVRVQNLMNTYGQSEMASWY